MPNSPKSNRAPVRVFHKYEIHIDPALKRRAALNIVSWHLSGRITHSDMIMILQQLGIVPYEKASGIYCLDCGAEVKKKGSKYCFSCNQTRNRVHVNG